MLKTILFDLDNTLIGNDANKFVPVYLGKLQAHLAQELDDAEAILQGILLGTRSMVSKLDPSQTLMQAFEERFLAEYGTALSEIRPLIDDFYANVYPSLASEIQVRPTAAKLIAFALAHGLEVVIATNPLFPETAILQRVQWGGIDPHAAPVTFVTHSETSHFAKPHPEYYAEILGQIGRRSSEVLLVGDDWENDVVGGHQMRIASWWIADANAEKPADIPLVGQGSLDEFYSWLQANIGLSVNNNCPRQTREIVARLRGTVANVNTLVGDLTTEQRTTKPDGHETHIDDNLIHLCQLDREALLPALGLVLKEKTDCQLDHFVQNRVALCNALGALDEAGWQQEITSPNGSPSTVESLAAFVAHHDRGHVQQIGRIVAALG